MTVLAVEEAQALVGEEGEGEGEGEGSMMLPAGACEGQAASESVAVFCDVPSPHSVASTPLNHELSLSSLMEGAALEEDSFSDARVACALPHSQSDGNLQRAQVSHLYGSVPAFPLTSLPAAATTLDRSTPAPAQARHVGRKPSRNGPLGHAALQVSEAVQ